VSIEAPNKLKQPRITVSVQNRVEYLFSLTSLLSPQRFKTPDYTNNLGISFETAQFLKAKCHNPRVLVVEAMENETVVVVVFRISGFFKIMKE